MKILKRILKILGITLISFVALLFIAALLTQTGFVKNRIRILIANSISQNINGTLHLGTIEGNFLTGFSIDSLVIYGDEGPLLQTGKVECAYDILPLFNKKLVLTSLTITEPDIRFIKSMDGRWNLKKLLKESNDTASAKSDWEFDLKRISIVGGSIRLFDSLALSKPDHWDMPQPFFEYHDFTIEDITLELNARLMPDNIRAEVSKFSCSSIESEFELKQLRGAFSVTTDRLSGQDVVIQTGKTFIECNASLSGVNIFRGIKLGDLQHDSTYMDFRANTIDLTELSHLLPQVRFLNGTVYAELEAHGEFGNLNIQHMDVKTYDSDLHVSGAIRNLHNPALLSMDITMNSGQLNPRDASLLLPPFGIPQFSDGNSFAITGHYTGYPVDFSTNIRLKGPSGDVDLACSMNLKAKPTTYSCEFSTKNLDCQWIFGNKNFNSSLNTTGRIEGKGFSINDITTNVTVLMDSSRINYLPINQSILTIQARPRYLHGEMTASSGEAGVTINGQGDFTNKQSPIYQGNLNLASFDLAKILNNKEYNSDLNLYGTFAGSGKTFSQLNAVLSLSLLPSVFRGHTLGSDTLDLNLDQRDPNNKNLSVQSPLFDAEFSGLYNLEEDVPLLTDRMKELLQVIINHTSPSPGSKTKLKTTAKRTITEGMDFQYYLKIKDLNPISSLLENIPFDARTDIRGKVKGNEDLLSLTSDGTIDEFFVGTTRGGILLHNGTVHLSLDSLTRNPSLEHLAGSIDLTSDSGLINTRKIENIRAALTYDSFRGTTDFALTYDSVYRFSASGTISVQPATYVFDFDSLTVNLGPNRWHNVQDVQLRLNKQGFQIMHAAFVRGDEHFSFAGAFLSSGTMDLRASLQNVNLSNLNFFLPNLEKNQHGFEGRVTAEATLTGLDSLPKMSFNAICSNTSYKSSRVGTLNVNLQYDKKRADILISAREHPNDSLANFTLRGSLPVDLAMPLRGDRFPNEEQKLSLTSDGFELSAIDPILKDFENLSGKLTCNLTVGGTPRYPELSGNMSFIDVRFLFLPNNISYILNANLEPVGDRINFKTCTLTNQRYKGITGKANFTGSISINDYEVSSFDIIAQGQVLLMTDATKRSMPEMYGTLYGETAASGLSLSGTPLRPFLSGTLFIREANLILPPTKTSDVKSSSSFSLRQIVVDDTTKKLQEEQKISRFFMNPDSGEQLEESTESPLIDRLRYNLNIETRGPTVLTMIFTPATGEELYAELEGSVNAINQEGKPTIYGTIEVTPRSYYNFFKRFDAKGNLRFIGGWNNPEFDIKASYEGYKQESETSTQSAVGVSQGSISSQAMKEQKVIVELNITGTRYEPKLALGMKVQLKPGDEPVDWSTQAKGGDVQSDAISFIITGKFRDQLTSREQQEFTDIGSSTGTSVASSFVSSIFSDALKKEFPFIRRADLSYRGGSIQEGTSVNVTATVLTGYLRAGGRILNDINNMNLSYQLNIGDVFKSPSIRNLFLEIQRKVEGDTPEDKKLTNEARLFYKFSF
jgi:hypothetical protein